MQPLSSTASVLVLVVTIVVANSSNGTTTTPKPDNGSRSTGFQSSSSAARVTPKGDNKIEACCSLSHGGYNDIWYYPKNEAKRNGIKLDCIYENKCHTCQITGDVTDFIEDNTFYCNSNYFKTPIILAAIIIPTILIILGVVLNFVCSRYIKKRTTPEPATACTTPSPTELIEEGREHIEIPEVMSQGKPAAGINEDQVSLEELPIEEIAGDAGNTYCNFYLRINEENLEAYLLRAIHSQDTELEFRSVASVMKKSCSDGTKPENLAKNRYKNNLPYNCTRVVLPLAPHERNSDYINASYVKSHNQANAFIAAQGPKDCFVNTIDDFWRMIWLTKSRVIIMMANLVEGGKVKVAQYWPDKDTTITKGGLEISLVKVEDVKVDYIVRTIMVRRGETKHQVLQYHFTAWPDHGVPEHPYSVAEMIKEISNQSRRSPFVVHCSAGIGRTGTVMLILHVLDQLKDLGSVKVQDALVDLREGRPRLVENAAQYRFGHQVLHEILYGEKTSFHTKEFLQKIQEFETHKTPEGTTAIEQQFKKLRDLPKDLTFAHAKKPVFADLNRDANILPADTRRVTLQNLHGDITSQYINAVNVNGLTKKNQFLVTEHPLPETLDAAWRLVYEKKAPAWIFLHSYPDNSQAYPNVIPRSGIVQHRQMEIKVLSSKVFTARAMKTYSEHTVEVAVIGTRLPSHKCVVIQMRGWPHDAPLPDSPIALLTVLDRVDSIYMQNYGASVFSCKDGASGCGVAVALQQVVTKAKIFHEVDVYRAAVSVTYDRPEFISTLEQYKFLYEAAKSIVKFKNQNRHSTMLSSAMMRSRSIKK